MNKVIKTTILLFITVLSACTLQDPSKSKAALEEQDLIPVINPCEKIDALISEYDNSFDRIKLNVINTRISKIWKAKYHLVGSDCQVWAWGNQSTTYACSTATPNEEVAQEYFDRAIQTARSCLSDSWQLTKQPRNNNSGYKAEFSQSKNDVMVSIHMVPTAGLFKSEWTVYYYVGNAR